MAGVLIVTGASRGIGAAVARLAGERGYDVAVNYLASPGPAEAVVKDIRARGRRAVAIKADVSAEADVLRLFEASARELGPIDALVNNAGVVTSVGRVEDLEARDIQRMFDINSVGAYLCAREAVRRMSTKRGGKGGAIVNVASRASGIGSPNEFVHYAGSKAAVDALTMGLAIEMAKDGVRVNAVSPGFVDSEIHYPGRRERLVPTIPMGRAGTAEEVAEAVLWLLSDKASYVTGAILRISGGR